METSNPHTMTHSPGLLSSGSHWLCFEFMTKPLNYVLGKLVGQAKGRPCVALLRGNDEKLIMPAQ